VSADAQSGNQHALIPLWQEGAVGRVTADAGLVWRIQGEQRVHRVAVAVEVTVRIADAVRIGAAVEEVQRRDDEVADDAAPFTRVDQLAEIEGGLIFVFRDDECLPHVQDIAVVGDRVIGIGVVGAQIARGHAGALHGDVGAIRVHALGACRDRDVGVAGGIDDDVRQDHPASPWRGHDGSFDGVAVNHRSAADAAEPDISARGAQLAPVPFHAALDVPSRLASLCAGRFHGGVDFGGKPLPVAPVIVSNETKRADATEAMEVLDDEGSGAAPRCRDARRRAARASPDDHHVVFGEHRQRGRLGRDRGQSVLERTHAGEGLAHVARFGRGAWSAGHVGSWSQRARRAGFAEGVAEGLGEERGHTAFAFRGRMHAVRKQRHGVLHEGSIHVGERRAGIVCHARGGVAIAGQDGFESALRVVVFLGVAGMVRLRHDGRHGTDDNLRPGGLAAFHDLPQSALVGVQRRFVRAGRGHHAVVGPEHHHDGCRTVCQDVVLDAGEPSRRCIAPNAGVDHVVIAQQGFEAAGIMLRGNAIPKTDDS